MKFTAKKKPTAKQAKNAEHKEAFVKSMDVTVVTDAVPHMEIIPRVDGPDILAEFDKEAREFYSKANTLTVTDEGQVELMAEARKIRLTLKAVRTAAEKKRVELVGAAKKELAKIDADFRDFREKLTAMEDRLSLQERYAEIKEEERITDRRIEREKAVQFYGDLNMSIDYGTMTDADFEKHLAEREAARDFRLAEEKRIKEEAIANDKERERLRIENEQKEARIRELEEEQKARDAMAAKAEYDREQEAARIARLESKAASAPDKQKLITFAEGIRKIVVPTCKTNEGIAVAAEVAIKCNNFANWIIKQTESL